MLLVVVACSNVQLGYNWSDTVALYYLNSYLDLDAQQEQQASEGLQQLLAWHRKNELPSYSVQLMAVQQSIDHTLSVQQLQETNEFVRLSLERTALRAVPMLVELILSLKPAQLTHLREQLAEDNAQYREEFLVIDAKQQQQQRYQLLLEKMQPWFGQLDHQQLALLRLSNSHWPVTNQFWYAERLLRQQEMLALLERAVEKKLNSAQLTTRLEQHIRGFERDRPAQRQDVIVATREQVMGLIVALARQSTPEQRQQAQAHALGLIEDFSVLIAQQ